MKKVFILVILCVLTSGAMLAAPAAKAVRGNIKGTVIDKTSGAAQSCSEDYNLLFSSALRNHIFAFF